MTGCGGSTWSARHETDLAQQRFLRVLPAYVTREQARAVIVAAGSRAPAWSPTMAAAPRGTRPVSGATFVSRLPGGAVLALVEQEQSAIRVADQGGGAHVGLVGLQQDGDALSAELLDRAANVLHGRVESVRVGLEDREGPLQERPGDSTPPPAEPSSPAAGRSIRRSKGPCCEPSRS